MRMLRSKCTSQRKIPLLINFRKSWGKLNVMVVGTSVFFFFVFFFQLTVLDLCAPHVN